MNFELNFNSAKIYVPRFVAAKFSDIVLLWKFMPVEPKTFTWSSSCKSFFKLTFWLWKYGIYDIAVSEDNVFMYTEIILNKFFKRLSIPYAAIEFNILNSTII